MMGNRTVTASDIIRQHFFKTAFGRDIRPGSVFEVSYHQDHFGGLLTIVSSDGDVKHFENSEIDYFLGELLK